MLFLNFKFSDSVFVLNYKRACLSASKSLRFMIIKSRFVSSIFKDFAILQYTSGRIKLGKLLPTRLPDLIHNTKCNDHSEQVHVGPNWKPHKLPFVTHRLIDGIGLSWTANK